MYDANKLHTRRCLAHAMICAIENARDMERSSDFDFRIWAQENTALNWADGYLADGTATCLCEPANSGPLGTGCPHGIADCSPAYLCEGCCADLIAGEYA